MTATRADAAPAAAGPLIIHIGMQKTGTTFLQNALHAHRTELAAQGIHYPHPMAGVGESGGKAHHFIAHAMLGRRLGHTPDADFDQLGAHVASINAARRETGGTTVISSEDFSLLRRPQIKRLRTLFPGDGVRILVYLRRQDLWLEALYGQTLKLGRHQNAAAFVTRQRHMADYAAVLDPWAEAFGAANVIVRVYEGFEGGGLWPDFCTAIGHPGAATLVPENTQINVSLPREDSTFLTLIGDDRWRHWLRRALERSQTRRARGRGLSYLTAPQARQIMADHAAGNARLAKRYLGREALFTDAAPLPVQSRPSWLMRRARVGWHLVSGLGLLALDRLRDALRRG